MPSTAGKPPRSIHYLQEAEFLLPLGALVAGLGRVRPQIQNQPCARQPYVVHHMPTARNKTVLVRHFAWEGTCYVIDAVQQPACKLLMRKARATRSLHV